MRTKPLGEFEIYINDGNYGNIYPSKEYFLKEGIPFISATDFKGKIFNYKGIKHVSNELHFDLLTKGHLKINDVLIVVRGNGIGKVGYFEDEIGECNINAQLAFIRTNPNELNSEFLYYLFSSSYYLEIIRRFGSGSAQPQLPINRLKLVPVVLKNIIIQRKIAKALSNLDAKIKLNNKINSELEAMAKTIYDYWFVQFDFPDKNGKPYKTSGGKMVFNEELKSEIPEGWEGKRLIDLCNKIGDGIHGTPKYVEESEYKFINGNNLKNGFIQTNDDTKNVSKEEYEKYFIDLNDESILLSINGTLGNLAVYTDEKVMLGKSSAYINCKSNYRSYCYQFLKQPHMPKLFWNTATGSTIKNLSLDSIKKLKIAKPNKNLLEEFDKKIGALDKKRKNIYKENQKLAELRDWLLPMLMNGQVSVK